jgi:S-adenosylmethionine:tRNA ribosyltransferase-isomerase
MTKLEFPMPDRLEQTLTIEDFAYELPESLIAQEPTEIRHQSRLLKLDRQDHTVSHHSFKDIVEFLKPGDVLVVNDTKVIPARFYVSRKSGGISQILLIKPEAVRPGLWQAMAERIKRLQPGEILTTCGTEKKYQVEVVDIICGADGQKRLIIDLGSHQNTFDLLKEIGFAPLPPYIRRDNPAPLTDESDPGSSAKEANTSSDGKKRGNDLERYQTVFAANPGAVAAPTAGLHFSTEVLQALQAKGVEICKVTLHVGPGTFKPITESIEGHHIESENFWISDETAGMINRAKATSRRVIAVGTTTCRALESSVQDGLVQAVSNRTTTLYIRPGFKFQVVDGLITNFHLSKSSLLVLVAAFAGREAIMNAYRIAIENQYRFYSYGDAMFII